LSDGRPPVPDDRRRPTAVPDDRRRPTAVPDDDPGRLGKAPGRPSVPDGKKPEKKASAALTGNYSKLFSPGNRKLILKLNNLTPRTRPAKEVIESPQPALILGNYHSNCKIRIDFFILVSVILV
jgi:hypothetical protein